MTWDFAASPSEKRSAFRDLLKRAPPDIQNRLVDLLFSVVFKNELEQLVSDVFVGAEIKTANFGSTWTIEFDSNGSSTNYFTDDGTPSQIVIPVDRPGYYRITIDGYANWPRPV